jgi:hypothetical protein
MHVLVAFEESYRTYRETIAAALRLLRPETTKISVGGRHFERTNPTVEESLEVIERSWVNHQFWPEQGLFTQVPGR